MKAEKLKRTHIETEMTKKAVKRKQKSNRINDLSKNGQLSNDVRSNTPSKNIISNFLKNILGVEEKARQNIEIKKEKEVATLPDSDHKTTKVQRPVERKVKDCETHYRGEGFLSCTRN